MELDYTTRLLFSPFLDREVANPKRAVINTEKEFVDFIEMNNGRKDCYASLYTLGGTINKIFWDLDGKNALKDAKELYSFFISKNYKAIPIASGKKGFNIHLILRPIEYYDLPKKLLTNAYLSIISDVFGERENTVDPHVIGDLRRVCRIPNTLRPPNNSCWCTYLPPDKFLNMSDENVAEHIKSPKTYSYDNGKYLPVLTDFKYEGREVNISYSAIPAGTGEIGDGNQYLKNILRPCLYRYIRYQNPYHFIRVATTIDLLDVGCTEHEILKIYSMLHWKDFDANITKYQIDTCKYLRKYSCKRLRAKGIKGCCH
ncbi:hypothetical protein KJ925_05150 [Patescibacteria group bacterium]|nr:hypothetical protein [Patescibacteria group bacterium]